MTNSISSADLVALALKCGAYYRSTDGAVVLAPAQLDAFTREIRALAVEERAALTDEQIEQAYASLKARREAEREALFQARIGTACTLCATGKFFADSNGYSTFHRCDVCSHVPMWNADSSDLVSAHRAPAAADKGEQMPEELFDGFSVCTWLSPAAKRRTSPENVGDVLDAVVRLINRRAAAPMDAVGDMAGEERT